MNRRSSVAALAAGTLLLSFAFFGTGAAHSAKAPTAKPTAAKVMLVASDSMRPDMMEQYAAQGAMPTYSR